MRASRCKYALAGASGLYFGTLRFNQDLANRFKMARSQMTEPEFHLCTVDRELVEKVIRKHCEIRQWTLHAVNPRSNHVHVVVTAPGYEPEPVYEQFKAWCTRHLKVSHKECENFWTERASRRWINHEEDLEAAVLYVLEAQDGDHGAASWSR